MSTRPVECQQLPFDGSTCALTACLLCRAVTELAEKHAHLRDPKLLVVGVRRLASVLPGERHTSA